MLPKKGSGGDHVTDPINYCACGAYGQPFALAPSPASPRSPRAAEVVSLPSPTTSNYTNPTSPLEDTI